MTAPAATVLPTRDEAVLTILERLYWLEKSVKKPQTHVQLHVSLNHIAVIRAALLTPPLRPEGLEDWRRHREQG